MTPVAAHAPGVILFRRRAGKAMNGLIETFSERGDLAHLALFLGAASASALAWHALRELAAASRRFDDFVRELARFNEHFGGK